MGRWAGAALIVLTLAMIGAGLWQVGGPEQARAEQRDDLRRQDLRALAGHLSCVARRDAGADVTCDAMPRQVDRFTDVPYTIEEKRVCAVLENPRRIADQWDTEFEDGCLAIN